MAIAQRFLQVPFVADIRSDKQLVRAGQAGQTRAVEALIERHYPRIYSFVSYMTGSAAAEDLTQEVFARALAALPKFNGSYRVGPWLLRIAKNLCIDESRRNGMRPSPTDPSNLVEMEVHVPADGVWETVSSRIVGDVVRQALERLPARQRAVLILREIDGMTYADIAQVVGTNSRGAEATLRRARSRFRMEVAALDSDATDRTTCRRTVRLLAVDPETKAPEVLRHLAVCGECRKATSSVRAADRLFGSLPPLALGGTSWKSDLLSHLHRAPTPRRSLMEALRARPQMGLASPIAQLAEIATSVAMAGAVSVASVAGVADRVTVVQAAPPAALAEVEVPGETPAQLSSAAPPEALQAQAAQQPEAETTPATTEESPATAEQEESGLGEEQTIEGVSGPVRGLIEQVDNSVESVLETQPDLPDLPVGADTSELPAQTTVLPSGLAAPRRRRIFWF